MARNDGRIEPGQKLAGAISARAWNRAQDAADRVLGVGTGFGAGGFSDLQYAIVVPVRLTTVPAVDYPHIGVAIQITSAAVSNSEPTQQFQYGFPVGINMISGQIAEPASLIGSTLLPAPEMFALTVEPMKSGSSATSVVRCAIKGIAIARVRQFSVSDRYVALPTRRSTSETVASLRGTLETSAAGYGRFVAKIDNDFAIVSI